MEYHLDYQQAADRTGLKPVLDTAAPSNVSKQVSVHVSVATRCPRSTDACSCPQAHILLDCGDDNICKPDLKLAVRRCVLRLRPLP